MHGTAFFIFKTKTFKCFLDLTQTCLMVMMVIIVMVMVKHSSKNSKLFKIP